MIFSAEWRLSSCTMPADWIPRQLNGLLVAENCEPRTRIGMAGFHAQMFQSKCYFLHRSSQGQIHGGRMSNADKVTVPESKTLRMERNIVIELHDARLEMN